MCAVRHRAIVGEGDQCAVVMFGALSLSHACALNACLTVDSFFINAVAATLLLQDEESNKAR